MGRNQWLRVALRHAGPDRAPMTRLMAACGTGRASQAPLSRKECKCRGGQTLAGYRHRQGNDRGTLRTPHNGERTIVTH